MKLTSKISAALVLAIGSAVFASAQGRPQNPPPPPPAQSQQGQQNSANPPANQMSNMMGILSGAGITPEMMQRMAPMMMAQMSTQPMGPQPPRSPQMMGRGRGRTPGPPNPLQMFSRVLAALDNPNVRMALKLTDQQADGLRKIVVDTEKFTIATGATIAVDGLDLREQMRADKPDRKDVMSKGDEISRLTGQLVSRYLDAMLSAKAILTPEQQKMIRTFVESRRSGVPLMPMPAMPGPPAPPAPPRP